MFVYEYLVLIYLCAQLGQKHDIPSPRSCICALVGKVIPYEWVRQVSYQWLAAFPLYSGSEYYH